MWLDGLYETWTFYKNNMNHDVETWETWCGKMGNNLMWKHGKQYYVKIWEAAWCEIWDVTWCGDLGRNMMWKYGKQHMEIWETTWYGNMGNNMMWNMENNMIWKYGKQHDVKYGKQHEVETWETTCGNMGNDMMWKQEKTLVRNRIIMRLRKQNICSTSYLFYTITETCHCRCYCSDIVVEWTWG